MYGEIKQFSCKMDVPSRLWDVKAGRTSGKSIETQKINHAVDKIRVDVLKNYAADVGAKLMDGVSSLLGTPKMNKIEQENKELKIESYIVGN